MIHKKKKICVFTCARSDYFLLRPLLNELQKQSDHIDLQLIASGMHTSKEFENTWNLIEADGYPITEKTSMLVSSDDSAATVTSMGLGMIQFSSILSRLKPDLVVLLGDRFEMMSFATAAHVFGIPIAHIHGGELTYGAFDDAIRHCITKMATLHFAATDNYKKRIIQMGEQPTSVFNVGALAVDNILTAPEKTTKELADALKIPLEENYFLITFHPETKGRDDVEGQLEFLFRALDAFPEHQILWTSSNADPMGRKINEIVSQKGVSQEKRFFSVGNLGSLYLSTLKNARAIVGNSSSGIIEAPILGIPTVNIGYRQEGRIRTPSIIDCSFSVQDISQSIKRAISPEFAEGVNKKSHPYGTGKTAQKIFQILKHYNFQNNSEKVFYEIEKI
jgi:UDP-hydrolysing UDP-N-acetyl-D-glucosamine 2-epimerase